MKKVENVQITRFETECFFIDIVEDEANFEAWLQEKQYGISSLMYGVPKHQVVRNETIDVDFDFFCEMIESDLDDYIYEYYAEYYNGWRDN